MAKISGDDAVEYVRRSGFFGGGSWMVILGVIVALLVLFNCTTRVETGHVGVLTLFSRVTGEMLPEGLHLINPLKAVHELSVQTQTLK
ncbi:MAG TPA: hypothetical protein VKG84_14505, partial [Candidatus Acidoferrales bacterium]|nr:hypothetical protein [Candidatus Acidoferrales bacterium]